MIDTPTKSSIKRERYKRKFDELYEAREGSPAPNKSLGKGSGKGGSGKGPVAKPGGTSTPRVPEDEWEKLIAMKPAGRPRCKFFNCSTGCRFGDSCKQLHACMDCGGDHARVAAHK